MDNSNQMIKYHLDCGWTIENPFKMFLYRCRKEFDQFFNYQMMVNMNEENDEA